MTEWRAIIDPESGKSGAVYTYSVKEYADALLSHTEGNWKFTKVAPLVKSMLNYGTAAQNYFDRNTKKPANADLSDEDRTLGEITNQLDAWENYKEDNLSDTTFNGATLSLKSQTSLSLYFTDPDELTFTCVDEKGAVRTVETVRKENTQIARIRDIAAAELQYNFTVSVKKGETELGSVAYSPMNYCYKALNGGTQNEKLQNVVKALYWYSQETYDYFYENIVDLGKLPGDYEAKKGDVLTGKLEGNKKITVAPGATVTLRKADITSLQNSEYRAPFAGITLLGDATVIIEGTNEVSGGYEDYPGILVPKNHTLTINGDGALKVYSNEDIGGCCGIGGKRLADSGNIVIKGGNIFAIGRSYCAAIGSSCGAACGTITISGGKIIATGGIQAAGIGSGADGRCSDIIISGGTVTATGGDNAAGIGSGAGGKCLDINISGGTVTAAGGLYGAGIGSGASSRCSNIIISGGTVTATGRKSAAGIGSGGYLEEYGGASCLDITITKDVILVTAIKGENAQAIGNGIKGTCGTITIEPGANVTRG